MKKKKHYVVYQITNKINDNIYIGVHITERINDKYMGSGSNIKKAIKEFGMENFEKIVLYNFDNEIEMLNKEKELVNEEFIIRGDTYNISLGGWGLNTENLVTVKDKNGNTQMIHKTDPRYLSGELVYIFTGMVNVKDKDNNNYQVSVDDPRYLSGELVYIFTGMVNVKDKEGNTLKVPINDPRYLSKELVGHSKGMVTVKDKYNNNYQVSVDDPRYLSGELVYINQGKKHSLESRLKTSKSLKGKYTGKENSQFGTCWIYNKKLKENKKIKKEELTDWVEKGWGKGRKMKI